MARDRTFLSALVALVAAAPGGCESGPEPLTRAVAPCTWSYFGDPRAVAHGDRVITGCVDTEGRTVVEDFDLTTGHRRLQRVFDPLEVDDHNNPSLVFFRQRLFVFSSPHSGYWFPRDRQSQMRYRVSKRPWGDGGGFGPPQTVPLGRGCGLGYTYPNPVVAGDRLFLFVRGPCWTPYFTSTTDGVRWTAPRTLLEAPPSAAQDGGGRRRVRPYAKYAEGPDGSVLMTFSDGHPASFPSSLYFLRYRDGRFERADGSLVGDMDDLPLRFSQLDRIHAHSRAAGRAWPMDVAADRAGAPVVVYTELHGAHDTFRYARWDGGRWRAHDVAAAGRTLFNYHNAGITLDHADPSRVVLSRTIGHQNEIEARHTDDHGATWTATQLTRDSPTFNIRPVIARGLQPSHRRVVLYVSGHARSFREYDTSVLMWHRRPMSRSTWSPHARSDLTDAAPRDTRRMPGGGVLRQDAPARRAIARARPNVPRLTERSWRRRHWVTSPALALDPLSPSITRKSCGNESSSRSPPWRSQRG